MTEHALETVTGPETLAEMQRTLDAAWSAGEVPEYTRMCLDLAVSEIGSNIIEHSGDGQPVRLRLVVDLLPDTVTVTLTDNGRPTSVDPSQTGMPDEMSERGRGLAIALRVLDELSYSCTDEGNRWTLMLRRGNEPHEHS
ncbi:MAG: ATP-binding protein [Mycobacterium sp.]